MRCYSCNVILSDFEATRKYLDKSYVDLCNKCWHNSQMYMDHTPVLERGDLGNDNESNWEDALPELR